MLRQHRQMAAMGRIIATSAFLALTARGEPQGIERTVSIAPVPPPGTHVWEFGPEVFNYHYEEPGLMEYEGIMAGFYARLTYYLRGKRGSTAPEDMADTPVHPPSPWVFRADGRLAFGRNDYDGQLQDGTPYAINGVDARSVEARLLFGRRFPSARGASTLYAGLGHRFKDDDSSSDPAGYKRESRYLYLPVTGEYVQPLQRGRSIIFTAEYTHLIQGEQMSDLSSMGLGKVTNEQRSGYGLRGAIAYAHPWRRGHAVVEAFVRHWDIDDSEIQTVLIRTPRGIGMIQFIEPENKTLEAGLSLRYRF